MPLTTNGCALPRFRVIVPVYKVQAYLHACLESVLDQPFTDLELIVVDDCSLDGSGAIIDEFAALDERVTAVHLPENIGLGPARNAGLEGATGEYVIFLDSDDLLTQEDVSWTYPVLLTAESIAVLDRVCVHYRQRRRGAITCSAGRRHSSPLPEDDSGDSLPYSPFSALLHGSCENSPGFCSLPPHTAVDAGTDDNMAENRAASCISAHSTPATALRWSEPEYWSTLGPRTDNWRSHKGPWGRRPEPPSPLSGRSSSLLASACSSRWSRS
jgi:hypothetical protein